MSWDMRGFEEQLLKTHVCAETHSDSIRFLFMIGVEPRMIMKALAAAVLRSNEEVAAFDAAEAGLTSP